MTDNMFSTIERKKNNVYGYTLCIKLNDEYLVHVGLYQDWLEEYLYASDLIEKYDDVFNDDVLKIKVLKNFNADISYKEVMVGNITYCNIHSDLEKLKDIKYTLLKDGKYNGIVYIKAIVSALSIKTIESMSGIKEDIKDRKSWDCVDEKEAFYIHRKYNINGKTFIEFPDTRSIVSYIKQSLL